MRSVSFFVGLLLACAGLGCGDDGDPSEETMCSDGADDDGDGRTDCADPDCFADPLCEGVDAGPGDEDAGPRPDGGETMDGGEPDAGRPDAGQPDAGPPPCDEVTLPSFTLEEITGVRFRSPVFVTQAPGRDDVLFVVEREGRIILVRDGAMAGVFLDMSGAVGPRPGGNDERGLLGLAFHPDYDTNGRFFVQYTTTSREDDRIAEYRRSAGDPNAADPDPVAMLVDTSSLQGNHNGGMLAFGPDGYLYSGFGDGGSGGDRGPGHGADGNGQNVGTLHGSLLRLDPDNAAGDFAAPDPPLAGAGGLPQIWAYGLRNPWRFSFDRLTGDLYIGDVGQGAIEEIDFAPRGSVGGENYGWRAFEGTATYDAELAGRIGDVVDPVVEFRHGSGDDVVRGSCSGTGGYVYRGTAIPELEGFYLYGDFCSRDIGAFRMCDGEVRYHQRLDLRFPGRLASFGQDNAGEVYLVDLDGLVYRLTSG